MTVYGLIFLQVKTGNKYASCCLLVRNMQRCVYAVPSPNIFPSHLLAEYEQESKLANNGKLNEFMKRLQVNPKMHIVVKCLITLQACYMWPWYFDFILLIALGNV